MPMTTAWLDKLARIERALRPVLPVLLLVVGALLAWRSFLARGDECVGVPVGEPPSCTSWEAWYRMPGIAVGLLLIGLGAVLLVLHVRARAVPRRGRRGASR